MHAAKLVKNTGGRTYLKVAGGLVLSWLLCSGLHLPLPRQPERLLEQAREAYRAGRYQAALEPAQQAFAAFRLPPRRAPDALIESLMLLGDIFMETGDPEGAFQQYLLAHDKARAEYGPHHLSAADALNGIGEYHYRRGAPVYAENYFRQALEIRMEQLGGTHEKIAASLNNLGNCMAAQALYAEAEEQHRAALHLRLQLLPADHPDVAVSFSNLGNCMYLNGKPEQALEFLEQARRLRITGLGQAHPKTAAVFNSMGNCLAALGRTGEALQHYEQALAAWRIALGEEHPNLASAMENMADLYFDRGDYIIASDYFRRAWHIQAATYGEASLPTASLLHKLGLCRQYAGDFDVALQNHMDALPVIMESLGPEHPLCGALHNNIGNCHAGMKNHAQAQTHYREALRVMSRASPDQLATILQNIGADYMNSGDPANALAAFETARKHLASGEQPALALSFKHQAMAAMRMGRYPLAEALADSALMLLPFCPPVVQTELRLVQGSMLFEYARRRNDAKLLQEAALTLDTALQHAELSLRQLAGIEAREYALSRQLPALRTAVQAYFLLYEQTRNPAFLDRAFALSETDKNLQWAEMARREMLERQSLLPDSLLRQEQALSAGINRLEKERLFNADPQLELQLATQRGRLREFIRQAEEAHPEYPGLHFTIQTPSIAFLQQNILADQQALIKYFDADSLWLVFVLTKTTATGLRLPKDAGFNSKVTDFRRCIQGYIGAALLLADSLAGAYAGLATELHADLIAPVERSPAGACSRWILIPDGAAAYLPFDALLRERPANPGLFKTHEYLLRKYAIAYAYSATHLALLTRTPPVRAKKTFAAFAPDFTGHPTGLPPLKHSETEARAAAALFNGKVFSGPDADAETFLREAGNYRILLSATHGKAGRTVGEMSYLAFSVTPQRQTPPVIYVRDLYTQRIPAELVVLSACETSVGEYRAGQGVISLTRGFFQAGARSVAATLWPVDDARHAGLMIRFFDNLKHKQLKDEALQNAKLHYIQNHPHDEAHPAYWAAGVAWGNMQALHLPGRPFKNFLVWAGAGLLLAVAGWHFLASFRRKK